MSSGACSCERSEKTGAVDPRRSTKPLLPARDGAKLTWKSFDFHRHKPRVSKAYKLTITAKCRLHQGLKQHIKGGVRRPCCNLAAPGPPRGSRIIASFLADEEVIGCCLARVVMATRNELIRGAFDLCITHFLPRVRCSVIS